MAEGLAKASARAPHGLLLSPLLQLGAADTVEEAASNLSREDRFKTTPRLRLNLLGSLGKKKAAAKRERGPKSDLLPQGDHFRTFRTILVEFGN